jgi:lipopolysaccharide transport system ATP-binding protein
MSSPSVSITGKSSGTVTVIMEYPKLLNGTYRLSLWFGDGITDYFTEMNCITFDIINMVNTRQWPASEVGPVSPVCKWIFE